jgi:hypothetical protein
LAYDTNNNGKKLDEFNSHRLLEKYDEALTVVELRETLETKDNGVISLSLIEVLIC